MMSTGPSSRAVEAAWNVWIREVAEVAPVQWTDHHARWVIGRMLLEAYHTDLRTANTHGHKPLTSDEAKSLVFSRPSHISESEWGRLVAGAVNKLSPLVADGMPAMPERVMPTMPGPPPWLADLARDIRDDVADIGRRWRRTGFTAPDESQSVTGEAARLKAAMAAARVGFVPPPDLADQVKVGLAMSDAFHRVVSRHAFGIVQGPGDEPGTVRVPLDCSRGEVRRAE